jgi:DNA helicase-4
MALDKYKNYFDNLYINVDSNIRLDINQRICILSSPKHELVIAGAGSGKTTTVAAKIKFMVDILNVKPESILLLSYTNEAVNEMKNIIVNKFKINADIMTFHKFAILLLGGHKNIKEFIVYDDIIDKYTLKEKLFLHIYLYVFSSLTTVDIKCKTKKFHDVFYSFEQDCNKYFFEHLPLRKSIKSFLFKINSNNYFKNMSNMITFDSLIYEACKLNSYDKHYKFVLIDEYQDISNLRFDFIKKYISKENSKLMCVGDDWQTIFSFASSNISNIINFKNVFNDSLVLKITNTYRNSQELIDIAGDFIMKNDSQIKKRLKSTKRLEDPIIFIKYSNKEELIRNISCEIDAIIHKKIAFISRYNFDINLILDNDTFKLINNRIIYKDEKEIVFYTIHTSKGLGFDYVFILNHNKGYYGFPSMRKSKGIFKK